MAQPPNVLVYTGVSCHPESLAHDAESSQKRGVKKLGRKQVDVDGL